MIEEFNMNISMGQLPKMAYAVDQLMFRRECSGLQKYSLFVHNHPR